MSGLTSLGARLVGCEAWDAALQRGWRDAVVEEAP
jgi:hypothetical protein